MISNNQTVYTSNGHRKPITREVLGACHITDDTQVKDVEPVIYIGDSVFAVKSDCSVVTGLPKAGKSAVSVFMIATALMEYVPQEIDTLQIRTTYCEGREVVYIDTEQPKAYTKRFQDTIKKLLKSNRSPPNLHIYNLRHLDNQHRKEAVFLLMKEYPKAHLAHLWIIDGIADLIKDPNDTEKSFEIVSELMIQSDALNTCIVVYLHENPGTQKMRGNLGSELERKCGGAITIKKDRNKGVHSIEPRLIRGSADFECIRFRYNSELGHMVSLNKEETEEYAKANAEEDQGRKVIMRQKLAALCLAQGTVKYSHDAFVDQLVTYSLSVEGKEFKKSTAKARLKEMVELNIVYKDEQGKYGLVQP